MQITKAERAHIYFYMITHANQFRQPDLFPAKIARQAAHADSRKTVMTKIAQFCSELVATHSDS